LKELQNIFNQQESLSVIFSKNMNNESSHDNIIEAKLSRFENIIEEKSEDSSCSSDEEIE